MLARQAGLENVACLCSFLIQKGVYSKARLRTNEPTSYCCNAS